MFYRYPSRISYWSVHTKLDPASRPSEPRRSPINYALRVVIATRALLAAIYDRRVAWLWDFINLFQKDSNRYATCFCGQRGNPVRVCVTNRRTKPVYERAVHEIVWSLIGQMVHGNCLWSNVDVIDKFSHIWRVCFRSHELRVSDETVAKLC